MLECGTPPGPSFLLVLLGPLPPLLPPPLVDVHLPPTGFMEPLGHLAGVGGFVGGGVEG